MWPKEPSKRRKRTFEPVYAEVLIIGEHDYSQVAPMQVVLPALPAVGDLMTFMEPQPDKQGNLVTSGRTYRYRVNAVEFDARDVLDVENPDNWRVLIWVQRV